MDENNQKQALELLDQATSIALVLPAQVSLDAAATAAAFFCLLSKAGKTPTILLDGDWPKELEFLNKELVLDKVLPAANGLEVMVLTGNAQLEQLSYTIEPDGVHIFLQSKVGTFQPTDVVARQPGPALDLIVTFGAASLEDLGGVYSSQVDLFSQTPKLVFDINPENAYFGTINLVDVTASSVGEVATNFLIKLKSDEVDGAVATALLTAITAATDSFQSVKTTPQTLSFAADLVGHDANQQEVVLHLYKTKPFELLKLWGRALARAQILDQPSLLYSELTLADFAKTGTAPQLAHSVLLEMIDNSSSAHNVSLVCETHEGLELYLASLPHVDQQIAVERLGGRVLQKTVKGLFKVCLIRLPVMQTELVLPRLIEALA